MSNLSNALENYYSREGRKILFRNNLSLNQLATAMWERLGLQQIDASVLSRVLKGERLFTSPQLRVFCKLLALTNKEEEYLFACLRHDHSSRLNLYIGTTHISSTLAEEVINELSKTASGMFYQGNYDELDKRHDLLQQLANTYLLNGKLTRATGESLGLSLYLKGRCIGNSELPRWVIEKTLPIYKQLLKMSQQYCSTLLDGYAHILLCNAYYAAGGYSNSSTKYRLYSASIKHAKKAIDNLPDGNHECLFALRTMAASAHYIHDDEVILYVLKKTKQIILKQPGANYISALHLSMTLSKCLVASNVPNPFSVKEITANYFQRDLSNTGIYEVSGIKEEIDTLLILRTQDTNYIRTKLKAGVELTNTYSFPRQRKYFNKLLRIL